MAKLIGLVILLLAMGTGCVLGRPFRVSCQSSFFQWQPFLKSLCMRLLSQRTADSATRPPPAACKYTAWGDWSPVRFRRYNARGGLHCPESTFTIVYERHRQEVLGNSPACRGPLRAENVTCKQHHSILLINRNLSLPGPTGPVKTSTRHHNINCSSNSQHEIQFSVPATCEVLSMPQCS